ncbi:membrane-associated tyrosine- and threonine-specific cdc2-inhibitory kinase [Lutzomyia longipalpis]|uniref:membrane-associated tyrosine- and threonine-specific cdc2-inhibitory kinase n=1 Tax=Lutzomyia longipalpis TaxID=7200 RepID=UPI002483FBB2|nr:membrane-associated tyrosine- and threonine-specific cdc2-inhibitory kinase [Lutzomyia longipalpis]
MDLIQENQPVMFSETNKSYLPLPDISDANLSHSFKSQKPSTKKKPPALFTKRPPHVNRSNSSSTAIAISFRCSPGNGQLSSMYQPTKRESYFDQCFEKICKIGEGSFGEVFKVRSREDGLLYAVKKSKQYFRSESYREERLLEVKRHEEFSSHDHCVTLYRAWEENDRLYIQMELCQSSLESYVMEHSNIPESTTWSFLLDLLLALKGLHDRNLIHLDIKLDNILVTEDGVCKLGDFGLVFDLNRENKESAMEGDSRYIAPELLEGVFSKAADIFSLGITMLELACNLELPSNGVLWQQLRIGILPEESKEMLSEDLYNVIRWMMNPDCEQRPSVNALLQYPRIKILLKRRKRWWSITKMRKLKRKAVQQISNKWHKFKKTLRALVARMSLAVLRCIHRKRKNVYEEQNFMSPLEMSDDDPQTSTPILGDSSINMSEVVNSTPILSYEKSRRRKTRLANAGSPQSNSSFEDFEDHLSRSPLNYTPRSVHDYSSLTCKKLFTHSSDSDKSD